MPLMPERSRPRAALAALVLLVASWPLHLCADPQTGSLTIQNFEGGGTPYTFAIQGTGVAAVGPEIAVLGNGREIAAGDATPSLTDDTDFGSVGVTGATHAHAFTIQNTGTADLNLTGTPKVALGGTHAADFAVTVQPGSPVPAGGGTTTFTVTFDPSAAGLRTATVSLANDDAAANPYTFVIQGTGSAAVGPEIAVLGNGIEVAAGDLAPRLADGTNFGLVTLGQSQAQTFTIANSGNEDLTLSGPPLVALSGAYSGDFSVTTMPASPVAPGANTTFTVTFTPTTVGLRWATVSIASNDADENPYVFNVAASGVADAPLWTTGANDSGQLGDGTTTERHLPAQVVAAGVRAVATGWYYTLFVKEDGTLWGTGANDYGQLGVGDTTNRLSPVTMPGAADVVAHAGGTWHSVFVKSDGTAWTVGRNHYGQLGVGDTTDRSTPIQVPSVTDVLAVAAGSYHTLFLKSDGTVWGVGGNWDGQLGIGNTANCSTPAQMNGATNVIGIAAGAEFSLILKADGTLWSVGRNNYGQLGVGDTSNRTTLVQVSGGTAVAGFDAGGLHSLFRKSDGTVWATGWNGNGQLGVGDTTNRTTPVQVVAMTGASMVRGGHQHSLFLRPDSALWCAGANNRGILGDGMTIDRPSPVMGVHQGVVAVAGRVNHTAYLGAIGRQTDIKISGLGVEIASDDMTPNPLDDTDFGSVSVGANLTHAFTIANAAAGDITLTGTPLVAVAGANPNDFLVTRMPLASLPALASTVFEVQFAPMALGLRTAIISIANNDADENPYTFAIQGTGVAAVGPEIAVLGNGIEVAAGDLAPRLADGTNFGLVTLGQSQAQTFTIANSGNEDLTLSGPPLVALSGAYAGDFSVTTMPASPVAPGASTTFTVTFTPTTVGLRWATVIIASNDADENPYVFNLVARGVADAPLWTVGLNDRGQLGDGTTVEKHQPVNTVANGVQSVGCGIYHSLFVKTDGSLWAMGANNYGQLGDGSTADRTTPVAVAGGNGVVAVAAGYGHSLFVKADGSLWAMGRNDGGQLGDGTTTNRQTPVPVVSSDVVACAAGYTHSLFLKTDGSLWGMGANTYGQLGDGSTSDHRTPVLLAAGGVVDCAAGGHHNLFVKADGSLWAVGWNLGGQVGDGTTTDRHTPVQIVNNGVVACAAGSDFSLLIEVGGSLWGMGQNGRGALGDGTTTNRLVPVPLVSNGVRGCAGGWDHSATVQTDASLWTVGRNLNGQLGDGTTVTRLLRVLSVHRGVVAVAGGGFHSAYLGAIGRQTDVKVSGLGVEIANGDVTPSATDDTDFGSVSRGTSRTHVFTIANAAAGDINLTGTPLVAVAGANPNDFLVTRMPLSYLPALAATVFEVQFAPTAPGLRTAIISIANNDADENPYTFAIQGTGKKRHRPVALADGSDSGCRLAGAGQPAAFWPWLGLLLLLGVRRRRARAGFGGSRQA